MTIGVLIEKPNSNVGITISEVNWKWFLPIHKLVNAKTGKLAFQHTNGTVHCPS